MTQFEVPPDPYVVTNLNRRLRNSFYISTLEVSEIEHYLEIQWMHNVLIEESKHINIKSKTTSGNTSNATAAAAAAAAAAATTMKGKRDEEMESQFRDISEMLNHFRKLYPDAIANMQVNDIAKISYRKQMDPLQRARQRHWYLINARVARVCETMLEMPGLRFFYGHLPLEQYSQPLQHIQHILEYVLFYENHILFQNSNKKLSKKQQQQQQQQNPNSDIDHENENEQKKEKNNLEKKDALNGLDVKKVGNLNNNGDEKNNGESNNNDKDKETEEEEEEEEKQALSLYDMSKRLYQMLIRNFPYYHYQDLLLCVTCDTKYHATSGKGFFVYQYVVPDADDISTDNFETPRVVFITFILAQPSRSSRNW